MKISEIMSVDPVCCAKNETAEAGAMLMQLLNVGVILVVENDKSYKLVGMVTDRDLCMAVVAEGKDAKIVTLEECMSELLVYCSPDEEIEEAIALMEKNQIRRLPIVDAKHRIQGIVSTADIAMYGRMTATNIERIIHDISQNTFEPGDTYRLFRASYFVPERPICVPKVFQESLTPRSSATTGCISKS